MTDDPTPLRAVAACVPDEPAVTTAQWVEGERTQRMACLRSAVELATAHDVWDARDIVIWAEYIRTGIVLDYTPRALDEARRQAAADEVGDVDAGEPADYRG